MSKVYKNLTISFSETEKWNTAAYIECIIGQHAYSSSSTSTRTRTHVITKYLYSYSHILQVLHYNDVIMSALTSQITSLTVVYWSFYSGADQRKPQSSASLAFVRGIHRWPVNSPHKGSVTRKMFPFDDVIICSRKSGTRPIPGYIP